MTATQRDLINLNAASQHELTQLPRIGADLARRIVHYRAIRKGFRDWEDFSGISGITAEDVEAIRARAWIGPPRQPERTSPDRRRTGHAEAMVRRPKAKGW